MSDRPLIEFGKVLAVASGGFGITLTGIDLVLKVMIGAATFLYICLKIRKLIKEK